MHAGEIDWLAEQASCHKRIVEIGSWTGRSTRVLVDNTPGTVRAVDTWLGSPGDLDDVVAKNGRWWAFDQFRHNLDDAFEWNGGNLSVTCADSLKAAADFLLYQPPFDMIFIDACHAYPAVCEDIKAWSKLLAPEGLLCGHDFTPRWSGVMQAVKELVPDYCTMENWNAERTIWWKPSPTPALILAQEPPPGMEEGE